MEADSKRKRKIKIARKQSTYIFETNKNISKKNLPTTKSSKTKNLNLNLKSQKPSPMLKYLFYFLTFATLLITILSVVLFGYNIISFVDAEIYSSIAFSLFLPSIVIAYLSRRYSLNQILDELGLSRNHISVKLFIYGIIIFFAILLLEIALSLFSYITGIPLPTHVSELLSGLPLYFILFSVFIAPLDEEIAFRGFLVKRIGIVASAFIFAILHASYDSIAEGVGAFIFGLIAGYAFKKTKSLYPSLIAHILVNLLAVVALFLFTGIL
ncbi:MAG: CPBP family intramembrane glutamic endopeptidase [Candidatus Micrarchaeia archaeon]